jgi:hypothetical protein
MRDKDAHLMMEALREVENPFAGNEPPGVALRAEVNEYLTNGYVSADSHEDMRAAVLAIIDKHLSPGGEHAGTSAPLGPSPVATSQGKFP